MPPAMRGSIPGNPAVARFQTSLNLVLLTVVLVQAWLLHGRDAARDPRDDLDDRAPAAASAGESTMPDGLQDDPLAMAVMDRLQRIDARLAALEPAHGPASGDASPSPGTTLDPRTFPEADRRLAALLPDQDLDAGDWVRWQSALAALPPAEQHAVSAAFARAVNADRIRLRF
jgi:hypothetical protein